MAKSYPEIDETLRDFIQAQSVFFVATAPLAARGHVNLSPKGLDTFRILGRAPSPISTSLAAASRPSHTCARTVAS